MERDSDAAVAAAAAVRTYLDVLAQGSDGNYVYGDGTKWQDVVDGLSLNLHKVHRFLERCRQCERESVSGEMGRVAAVLKGTAAQVDSVPAHPLRPCPVCESHTQHEGGVSCSICGNKLERRTLMQEPCPGTTREFARVRRFAMYMTADAARGAMAGFPGARVSYQAAWSGHAAFWYVQLTWCPPTWIMA